MTIGLIDEDWESRKKMTFPNLSLMKISAWHKARGDTVEWYCEPMGTYDKVYMSRIFSDEYTKPYSGFVDAAEIVRGGGRVCNICGTGNRMLPQRPGSLACLRD